MKLTLQSKSVFASKDARALLSREQDSEWMDKPDYLVKTLLLDVTIGTIFKLDDPHNSIVFDVTFPDGKQLRVSCILQVKDIDRFTIDCLESTLFKSVSAHVLSPV